MAVKLRLKRMGRSHLAFFRLHAVDSRSPVDGRVIEELGYYHPGHKDPSKQFVANLDRCKYWMDRGAQPTETVSSLLKKSGLDHKMLKLPKPGKPKADPAEAKKAESKAAPEGSGAPESGSTTDEAKG
ncbi:MAG: 30S ribosomal protein S16 [Phycisphaerae bacterium]|nr:30S ribosomal protein S16 [Phycisphaerae bacterium]MDW8262708.1 30S ribosomal protein S16 [Phycisphaerales bacterium]